MMLYFNRLFSYLTVIKWFRFPPNDLIRFMPLPSDKDSVFSPRRLYPFYDSGPTVWYHHVSRFIKAVFYSSVKRKVLEALLKTPPFRSRSGRVVRLREIPPF